MAVLPISYLPDDFNSRKTRTNGWFHDLSPLLIAEYDRLGTHSLIPVGGTLFTEGQASRSVAFVCEGRIKLTRSSREGKTLLVKIAATGDLLGLSAALSKKPYEVTAQVIERAVIKIIPQQAFLRFIQLHAGGSLQIATSISDEYRSVLNEASRLALSSSIAGRVAHLLLELAETDDPPKAQPEIPMALTHQELASMLGSSRESITRVLSSFRRRGILSIQGTRMTILRKEALERLL